MSALAFDDFVKSVKGGLARGRKLTASEVSDLKREYDVIVQPVVTARAEIASLEGAISNIVNTAYCLSEADVALLWNSAPPRMPFTPAGMIYESAVESQDDEDGDA